MKMTKRMLIAAAAMVMCLTACGKAENSEPETGNVTETTEAVTEVQEETTEEETEEETVAETEETTEESAEEGSFELEPVAFELVEGLSEKYADLDNRAFAYDGKIYTLGESTLKDMIDGGIPFDEDELNNKGNNVNSNYETAAYTVRINDFVSIQLSFINITEDNPTEEECLLSEVRWYTIYVPKPDFDDSRNEEIVSYLNDAASKICFSFPLDLTKEQLLENNSDATEIDDYNGVEYKIDSEIYLGDSGYDFDFNSDTNQLEEVYITWIP